MTAPDRQRWALHPGPGGPPGGPISGCKGGRFAAFLYELARARMEGFGVEKDSNSQSSAPAHSSYSWQSGTAGLICPALGLPVRRGVELAPGSTPPGALDAHLGPARADQRRGRRSQSHRHTHQAPCRRKAQSRAVPDIFCLPVGDFDIPAPASGTLRTLRWRTRQQLTSYPRKYG